MVHGVVVSHSTLWCSELERTYLVLGGVAPGPWPETCKCCHELRWNYDQSCLQLEWRANHTEYPGIGLGKPAEGS